MPTIAESGFPGFESSNIWGLWAPSGTPEPIVGKLRDAIAEAMADPDVREWYRVSGLSTMKSGVEEMMRTIHAQRARWPEVIKAAHIKLD